MTTRTTEERRALAFMSAVAIVVLMCVAAAWAATDRHVCLTEAARNGTTAQWSLTDGCRVQHANGSWMPAPRAARR